MSNAVVHPAIGSLWQHYNGAEYEVILIANLHSQREEYPVTVVYRGVSNQLVWSRPLSDWYRSMKSLGKTIYQSEGGHHE